MTWVPGDQSIFNLSLCWLTPPVVFLGLCVESFPGGPTFSLASTRPRDESCCLRLESCCLLCCFLHHIITLLHIQAYSYPPQKKQTSIWATPPASHCPQNVSPSVKSILLEAAICWVLPSGLRDAQCGPNEDEEIPDLDFAEACNSLPLPLPLPPTFLPTAAVCAAQARYETTPQDCSLSARRSVIS